MDRLDAGEKVNEFRVSATFFESAQARRRDMAGQLGAIAAEQTLNARGGNSPGQP